MGMAVGAVGCLLYAGKVADGEAQPRLVTWLLWALAPPLAFAGQLIDGAGLAAAMTLGVGAGPAFILTVTLIKGGGSWAADATERACLVLGALGLCGLLLVRAATFAVLVAVAVDVIASIPTVRQAWRNPHLESPWPYVTAAFNACIALLALPQHSIAKTTFPLYILLICVALTLLSSRKPTPLPIPAGEGRSAAAPESDSYQASTGVIPIGSPDGAAVSITRSAGDTGPDDSNRRVRVRRGLRRISQTESAAVDSPVPPAHETVT